MVRLAGRTHGHVGPNSFFLLAPRNAQPDLKARDHALRGRMAVHGVMPQLGASKILQLPDMSALSRQIVGCPAAQASSQLSGLICPRARFPKPFQGSNTGLQTRRTGRSHVRQPLRMPLAMWKGLGLSFTTDPAEKVRKKYQGSLDAMNALESGLKSLTDEQLRAKTEEFKKRLGRGETVDDLLVEAFAVRTGGMAVPQVMCGWWWCSQFLVS